MGKTNETRSEEIERVQNILFESVSKSQNDAINSGIPEADQFYSCAAMWLQLLVLNLADINVSLAKIAEYCDELKAAEEERRFNEDF